jgi:hypothetical protein
MEPPAAVLQKVENANRSRTRIVGPKPGHIGFPAEPGGLTLGVAASCLDRLCDRLVEADPAADVLSELTVTDRLKGLQTWIPTGV